MYIQYIHSLYLSLLNWHLMCYTSQDECNVGIKGGTLITCQEY